MKCTIPEISWHNRDPVLSVDLQAGNKQESFQRLATGGTDAHVVIWHIEIQQTGGASVEFAADLQRHQKAVNVVRFSPSGEFLASGDDESVIIIWKQKTDQDLPEMPTADSEGNKEQWLGTRVLRGHVEDVYDLCWSPDSMNLVSGSVDNSAILWDVHKGRNLGILRDHKGFVQGVAWDPLNKYVATLGSDRTCRIYNIKTKKIVNRINKAMLPVPENSELHGKVVRLFHDDTLKSFFRRLCFSPDGQLLIAPSGIIENANSDKSSNATHIFTRRMLNRPSAFLPSNNQYTVAVRCCPVLFELRNRDSVFALPYRIILAVATQKSILLFDTQQPEPFGIVSNIHYTRLTDLTWSHDGRMLIVSSTDGYCSIITFAEGELGQVYCKENISTETKSDTLTTPSKIECLNADSSKNISLQDNMGVKPDTVENSNMHLNKNVEFNVSRNFANKSENQNKTPEKTLSDQLVSPVTPKDNVSVALSYKNEMPKQTKPASATNSPSTNYPRNSASPSQNNGKRIKPVLISESSKSSLKIVKQTFKKPETHRNEFKDLKPKDGESEIDKSKLTQENVKTKGNTGSSDDPETVKSDKPKINEIFEHSNKKSSGASELKSAAEKMEVDNESVQKTVNNSTTLASPVRSGNVTPKQEKRMPRRVQLITLSSAVSGKNKSETKTPEKNIDIKPEMFLAKESTMQENMEIDLCEVQNCASGSDILSEEAGLGQQEFDKRKVTILSQGKSYEATTAVECMETDDCVTTVLHAHVTSKVKQSDFLQNNDEKTTQKQLGMSCPVSTEKFIPKTKATELEEESVLKTSTLYVTEKLSQEAERSLCNEDKTLGDSKKPNINQDTKLSEEHSTKESLQPGKDVKCSSPHKNEEQMEHSDISKTPHRTSANSLTPSSANTTPNSPPRNESRSSNVTPGQEKRTPRRVQLITLSSPKSKKKLL